MKQPPVLIKNIQQIDNHCFRIEWSDGGIFNYRLSDLQRNCPCAKCQEIKDRNQTMQAEERVRAVQINSVGRYALRIQFTSGCSAGIYTYALLREIAREKAK